MVENKIEITEKDFNDLGITFAYKEYGGPCTIYGAITDGPASQALTPKNDIHVAWDTDWDEVYSPYNVTIYSVSTKIKLDRMVYTKDDLVKVLEEYGRL